MLRRWADHGQRAQLLCASISTKWYKMVQKVNKCKKKKELMATLRLEFNTQNLTESTENVSKTKNSALTYVVILFAKISC